VPAYFYPGGAGAKVWRRLIKSAKRINLVVIVNPAGGPGKKADPNYVRVIGRARKAGGLLLGYVDTHFARRPMADVKADVDGWARLYPGIGGIFFDEQAPGADKVDYYVALYRHARSCIKGGLVATNPGTSCARAYVSRPASDLVCLFENAKGFEKFEPPAWVKDYPASRFAALAHHVSGDRALRHELREAVRKGVGNLFVTDAGGANPWDRLPSYWDAEVAAIERLGGRRHKK
jgi:hypothetical protein